MDIINISNLDIAIRSATDRRESLTLNQQVERNKCNPNNKLIAMIGYRIMACNSLIKGYEAAKANLLAAKVSCE